MRCYVQAKGQAQADGAASLSSGAALVSADAVGEPEDIGCEYGQCHTADDQPSARQVGDERNQRPQQQRESEPAEEKRTKEPPRLDAVVRVAWRRDTQCSHMSHLQCIYPGVLL